MAGHDIITIGASTGGVDALRHVIMPLPADLAATVLIVMHRPTDSPSLLAELLQSVSKLPVTHAVNGETITPGRILVAPPDYHLLIQAGQVRLTHGPKENRFRPAIDPLFRSAAYAYGARVIGVVLTGNMDDGTAGLWAIKDRGGLAIVQEPEEAVAPSMPRSALTHVLIDYRLPVREIGFTLAMLTTRPTSQEKAVSEQLGIETRIALEEAAFEAGVFKLGKPSTFVCPECHGVLLQVDDEQIIRFRCHTGHAYSLASLFASVQEAVEQSLWSTVRSMEELLILVRHLEAHNGEHAGIMAGTDLQQQAQALAQRIQLVRQALFQPDRPAPTEEHHA